MSGVAQVIAIDAYGFCPQHGLRVSDKVCRDCKEGKPASIPSRRLNVGCGRWPLLYWTNLDADPHAFADLHVRVPPLPYQDASLDEIFAGHFLEHLSPTDASAFLSECLRCLVPGGRLGVVVPDTREVLTRWLRGDPDRIEYPGGVFHAVADLDAVCALFLYSTVQDSPHQWSYDAGTLRRRLGSAGFEVIREIDRQCDGRLGTGQWYQCGWDAIKPL